MKVIPFGQEDVEKLVCTLTEAGIDSATYGELSSVVFRHPIGARLAQLDPFSPEYRESVIELYHDLRGGRSAGTYDIERHEASGIGKILDPHIEVSPWSFRDPRLISEFFYSWGQIFRHLEIKAGQSLLEYGPGSGQALLMLARAGVKCFGVDIDERYLELIRRQAADLKVDVQLVRAPFGRGFDCPGETRKFDRILFFEAFHHELDAISLLIGLHGRLNEGGRVVLCGEPITPEGFAGVPYPWGPRLDALSVFCIRHYGWMELGYQYDTFVAMAYRCGWTVTHHAFELAHRADVFVLEPICGRAIDLGKPLSLGACSRGWSTPEGTHRWFGSAASFPLPLMLRKPVAVELELSNFLDRPKMLTVSSADREIKIEVGPGETRRKAKLDPCRGATVDFACEAHSPGPHDPRQLGLAIHTITITESTEDSA